MVHYDTVERHCYLGTGELPEELKPFEKELEGQERITIVTPRAMDRNGRIVRLLPAFMVPYKRYSANDIESELDDASQSTSTANEATRHGWR
ncbi:hypothetical protein EVA_20115, partial [gut metagenome]